MRGWTTSGSSPRSCSWRRFCRIDIDGRLPHPMTLMKLTIRCGEQAIAALNVLDHTVAEGNPADAPQLAPAIERITQRARRPPRAMAADRGYGEAAVETDLHDAGVTTALAAAQA